MSSFSTIAASDFPIRASPTTASRFPSMGARPKGSASLAIVGWSTCPVPPSSCSNAHAIVLLPERFGPTSVKILWSPVAPVSTYPNHSCSSACESSSPGHSSSRNFIHRPHDASGSYGTTTAVSVKNSGLWATSVRASRPPSRGHHSSPFATHVISSPGIVSAASERRSHTADSNDSGRRICDAMASTTSRTLDVFGFHGRGSGPSFVGAR